MSNSETEPRNNVKTIAANERLIGLGVFLIIASAIGLLAAFELTYEKIQVLIDPEHSVSCDFTLLVQCGANMNSPQGSIFGFPNSLLGLIGWPVVMATGVGSLAGARFARWWWIAFNVAAAGALGFAIWLISISVFTLGTLCPWCMVTWIAVIPVFWVSTFWNLKHGVWSNNETVRDIGSRLLSWSPTVVIASYLTVAVIAQVRLDWLSYL
jgi:uncharacterized membrane protein